VVSGAKENNYVKMCLRYPRVHHRNQLLGFFIGIFLDLVRQVLSLLWILVAARKTYKIFPKIYQVCKTQTIKEND
jgi:hypothetical protein